MDKSPIISFNKCILYTCVYVYVLRACARAHAAVCERHGSVSRQVYKYIHIHICMFSFLEKTIKALMSTTESMLIELARVTSIYLWH